MKCTESPHFDEEPTIGASEIVYRLQLPQCLHDAIATLRACDGERGGHHSCHDLLNRDARIIADYAPLSSISYNSPSEENSDGSMTRLRNGVTKRIESARGEFNQVTMEYVLGALAMSINLFEQSEKLDDQTPAEAAGVETPYRNWEDMVVKTKATNNLAASRDSSSETMAEGQDPAESVETTAEGRDPTGQVETIAEGQDAEEQVETMAEGQDPAESVETMAGEKYKTIAEELREILKELEQHCESLIREHRQVVRDQQAVKRTMEILNKEQPAVNDVSQETAPVA